MTNRKATLADKDQSDMDVFLGTVSNGHREGTMSKAQCISVLAHVIAAVDLGNYGEALNWFRQGHELIR